jgi:thiol-disulfide isomerase/thioredoxin
MKSRFTRVFALLALLVSAASAGYGQGYRSYTLDALEARMKAGADTVYVVNFWATWCAPCIRELPYFDQLHQQHQGKPLRVLLVSLDAPSRAASALPGFLAKRSLQAEVLHLNEGRPHEYIDRIAEEWSGSIPATLLRSDGSGLRQFYEGEMTLSELQQWVQPALPKP